MLCTAQGSARYDSFALLVSSQTQCFCIEQLEYACCSFRYLPTTNNPVLLTAAAFWQSLWVSCCQLPGAIAGGMATIAGGMATIAVNTVNTVKASITAVITMVILLASAILGVFIGLVYGRC